MVELEEPHPGRAEPQRPVVVAGAEYHDLVKSCRDRGGHLAVEEPGPGRQAGPHGSQHDWRHPRAEPLLRPRVANQVFTVVLGVLALAAVLLASYNVETCFAFPQSLELRLMRSQLASRNLARVRSIYVIGATWRDSIAPTERYDEFGLPFSAQPWAPGAAVHLLLRERGGAWSKIPVEVAPVGGPIKPPHGALVVDMRKLAHFR